MSKRKRTESPRLIEHVPQEEIERAQQESMNGDEPHEPTNGEATPEPLANLAGDLTAAKETPKNPEAEEAMEKLDHIYKLEDEVSQCEADYLIKADLAKAAKKCLERAQDGLNRYIRALQEKLPLFDKPAAESKPEPEPEPTEPWREITVRALKGLPDSIHEVFEEAGLFTVGQLCDWRTTHELRELPGIGPKKVDQIEDALEALWARQDLFNPKEEEMFGETIEVEA